MVTAHPHPQQYASHHARTEGAASSQAAATALQGGRGTPARQVRGRAPVCPGGPPMGSPEGAQRGHRPPFPADVDECSVGGSGCPQRCVNTVGSYWCQCQEGHSPSADGELCLPTRGTPGVAPSPTRGKLPTGPTLAAAPWGTGRAGLGCWAWRGHQGTPEGSCRPAPSPGGSGALPHREDGWWLLSGAVGRWLGASCQPRGADGPTLGVLPVSPPRTWTRTSAGDGTLLLLVRAVTLQTRTVSNNALSPARHQERSTDLGGDALGTVGTPPTGRLGGLRLPRATAWAALSCQGHPQMRTTGGQRLGGPIGVRGQPGRGCGLGPRLSTCIPPGVDSEVKEEVQKLRSRVDVLEQVRPGGGATTQ